MAFLDAPPPSRRRSAAAFALFAGATLAAGAPGARSISARSAWYRATSRPRWPPPASAFRPVWTALSALAGAALLLPAVAAYAGAARRVDRLAAALVVPHLAASAFVLARRGELVRRGRGLLAHR